MDRTVATKLVQDSLQMASEIDRSVSEVMKSGCTGEQFEEYRTLAARLLGTLYTDILMLVFREYPDLQPKTWREGSTESPPFSRDAAIGVAAVARSSMALVREMNDVDEDHKHDVLQAASEILRFVGRWHPDLGN